MNRKPIIMGSNPTKIAMRYNKDGTLDRRYKMARRIIAEGKEEYWDAVPISGKALPKVQKKATKKSNIGARARRKAKNKSLPIYERAVYWIVGAFLTYIIFLAPMPHSKGMDASLYKTAYAGGERVIESNLEASRVYLENPRTLDEIKNYIRYKFGENYQVACMIAYGEGLLTNWVDKTPLEYSVGIFQINLAGAYGHGWKVHWDKVQGETLEEKTAWLLVPKNNVDLAYTMSKGGTDWGQWSAYTNGSYKKFAEECK